MWQVVTGDTVWRLGLLCAESEVLWTWAMVILSFAMEAHVTCSKVPQTHWP
jgi:hypothetical protein